MQNGGGRILFVEDDADLRELMMMGLQGEGFTVSGYGSGAEAVAAIRRERFDVALLDIDLPDTRGDYLMRRLRSIAPGLFVILVSGSAPVDIGISAVEDEADSFLTKPYKLAEIMWLLQRSLRTGSRKSEALH